MEHLVIAVAVVIIIAILVNAFIAVQEPFKSILNVVLVAVLIIILLRGTAFAAYCSPQLVCDFRNHCETIQVCR